jgi:hypothetical protein
LQLNFAIELVSDSLQVSLFLRSSHAFELKAKAAVAKPKDVPISKIVSGSKNVVIRNNNSALCVIPAHCN